MLLHVNVSCVLYHEGNSCSQQTRMVDVLPLSEGFAFCKFPLQLSRLIFPSSGAAVGWRLKKHSPGNLLKLLLPGCWKMAHQPSCAQMFLLITIVIPRSITLAARFPPARDMATTLELNKVNTAVDADG